MSRTLLLEDLDVLNFGWKKKAELLRRVMLTGGHQLAKELPPGLSKLLEIYARVHKSSKEDVVALEEETVGLMEAISSDPKPIHEPAKIYGWDIEAYFYLQNGQLWWLLYARRPGQLDPSDKDVAFLDKVLEHLGADPKRDMIIGPRSRSEEEGLFPFGWWTWFNREPLFEIQGNKDKKGSARIRCVPLGTPESDGYRSLDNFMKEDHGD